MQLKEVLENDDHSERQNEKNGLAIINEKAAQNYQYFEEYCRLYKTAFNMSQQLKNLCEAKQKFLAKLSRYEKKTEDFKDDIRGQPLEKKKRVRKAAEQIQRNYICEVERCQKAYGSEGSLKQHLKLKHPELYQSKSDRYKNQNQAKSQLSHNQ